MRGSLAIVLASVVVVAAAGSGAGADAETTLRGTIAYQVFSDRKTEGWIEALDLASGRVTRLTAALPLQMQGTGPASDLAWSPGGTKLAFTQWGPKGASNSVKVIDVTSRRVFDLTAALPTALFSGLAWSPDGTSIAFRADGNSRVSGIHLAMPGLPGVRRLSHRRGDEISWSPRGDRLAFVADSTPGEIDWGCGTDVRIVVAAVSGRTTEIRARRARAKGTYSVHDLAWQPNGDTLLYVSNVTAPDGVAGASNCYGSGSGAAVFVLDPSRATSKRAVAWSWGSIEHVRWSPEGRSIAVHHVPNGYRSAPGPLQLMTPTGQGRRTLVSRFDGQFSWTRGGQELIEAGMTRMLLRDVSSGRAHELARWVNPNRWDAQILALGTKGVAVDVGAGHDRQGQGYVERRVAVAHLNGGGSRVIVLEPPSPAFRLGPYVAASMP